MKISDIKVDTFRYRTKWFRDYEGHSCAGAERWTTNNMLTIRTDEGAEGYFFAGPSQGVVDSLIKPALLGQNPFFREKIWQRMRRMQKLTNSLPDMMIAHVDCALWDLAGRYLRIPVYKMIGAARTRIPAYASINAGDDIPGGLSSPEDYARFSEELVRDGFRAIKLHTWMSPLPGAPDVKRDVAACAAVREAVGPDITLMLDPHHHYDRIEALYLSKEIEKLDFLWIEEPMNEYSMSSYAWLNSKLDMAVLGPENLEGSYQSRAEWVVNGACDMLRGGTGEVGGITPILKLIHLAQAFNLRMEVHGGGPHNMHVLCTMDNGWFYEWGLLHPMVERYRPLSVAENALRSHRRGRLRPGSRASRPGGRHRFRLRPGTHHRRRIRRGGARRLLRNAGSPVHPDRRANREASYGRHLFFNGHSGNRRL